MPTPAHDVVKIPASRVPISDDYPSVWRVTSEISARATSPAWAMVAVPCCAFYFAASVWVMKKRFFDGGADGWHPNFLKFRESWLMAVNHTAKWRGVAP